MAASRSGAGHAIQREHPGAASAEQQHSLTEATKHINAVYGAAT
jgi:hypothetical protein